MRLNSDHNASIMEGILPKKFSFGIDGYYLPKTVNDVVKTSKWQKGKDIKRFSEIISDNKRWVPPPNQYQVNDTKSSKQFKIYTMDRKTLEEVDLDKKRNVPPPGSYNPKPLEDKVKGPYKSTTS
jgi:hypothetical protein